MKRFLGILMALCLLLGCVSVANAEDTVTLHWWYRGNGEQADTELVNARVNEMLKSYEGLENVEVVLHPFAPSDYQTQVLLGLSAGEPMDILNTVSLNLYQLVEDGTLRPIDEYMPLATELTAELPQQMIDYGKVDGVQYIICHQQQIANGRSLAIPTEYIEKGWVDGDKLYDMFRSDNYGKYTVAEMMDEMEKSLLAVREGTGNSSIYLTSMANSGTSNYNIFIGYHDSVSGYTTTQALQIDNATHTVYFTDMEPGVTDVMARMGEWYDKGYIREDIASLESTQDEKLAGYQDETGTQKCYITYGHNGFTDDLSKELAGTKIDVYTVHTNPYCWTTLGQATGTSIPFTCGEPERAMMFMNWLVTKDEKAIEFYNLYSYGIEGKHYEWNEEHTDIKVFGGDGQADSSFDWGQRPWMMGTLLNAYSCAVYPAPYYEELIKLQESAYTSPLLGFTFDYSDVETEFNLLSSIGKEYGSMLDCGYLGAAGVEAKEQEYRDKMYAAGLQNVIDAIQEQVTAFVEKNERTW